MLWNTLDPSRTWWNKLVLYKNISSNMVTWHNTGLFRCRLSRIAEIFVFPNDHLWIFFSNEFQDVLMDSCTGYNCPLDGLIRSGFGQLSELQWMIQFEYVIIWFVLGMSFCFSDWTPYLKKYCLFCNCLLSIKFS